MGILNVQPVVITKDISGFPVQFFNKLRQSCQLFGASVCMVLLCDFFIMLRKIQVSVPGEGGDVHGIKVSHKIATLGLRIVKVPLQILVMDLPSACNHPVDFDIELLSVFIRSILKAGKELFTVKGNKGDGESGW